MNRKFSVILKRIIAVNSAKFAYAEIPLDNNLVIFGSGNLGKTSIVNAVRFFLLPELNLKNSDSKFGFISGKGESNPYFTKDQIYDHYFPTDDSRLILEVEHLLLGGGKQYHCQIISRGGDYGLKRCFIPEPYSEIEHLFWDKYKKEAGAKPKHLPGQKLLAELNKINSNTKQYSQYEQLTQALYTADILRPETCPFVIFPLKDTKPSAIDSLRALVKMLFNQDERSLRLMTATSIELRDQDDNVLALDIESIISEQADLRRRREQLDLFKLHEPTFIDLQQNYQTLLKEREAELQFVSLYMSLKGLYNKQNENLHSLARQVHQCKTEQSKAGSSVKTNEGNSKVEARLIADLTKKIERQTVDIDKASVIISSYFGKSIAEIIDILKEDLATDQSDIEAYKDSDKKRIRLDNYKIELEKKNLELKQLIARMDKIEFSLINQLDRQSILKLAVINKKLADANPQRKLSQNEIDSINGFTTLFKSTASSLHFFDATFPFFNEFNTENSSIRIDELRAEIRELNQKITALAEFDISDRFSVGKKITELSKKIKSTESDLTLLKDLDYNQRNSQEQKKELEQRVESLARLESESLILKVELQRCNDEVNSIESLKNDLHKKQMNIDSLLSRFNLFDRFPNLSKMMDEVSIDDNCIFTENTEEQLFNLSKLLEHIKRTKDNVRVGLIRMITLRLIEDEYGLLTGNSNDEDILSVFESLAHKYTLLNEDGKVLEQAVRTHNEHFRNRLERLDKTRDRVNLFIKQINEDLSHAVINDLEAVRLSVALHPFFEDLVNSWREYDDLSSDGTLPEEWYHRLRNFLTSDAVNQTDKILRMENVIKSAGYETKKTGESWDNKAQSNSTKMLINTHLCEIFIEQLSDDENASVQFPVIMDEIGSVSSEQFPALIHDLNLRGRKLIGVTVHGKSGDVTAPFQNILIMDELLTSEPYSNQRRNVCFSRDIETVTKKISEQTTLFGGGV